MHTSFKVIKYPNHLLELARVSSQGSQVYQQKIQELIKSDPLFCYQLKLLLGNSWKGIILKTDRIHLFDLLLSSFIHRQTQGVYLSENVAIYAPFLEEFVSAFSSMTTSSNPRLKVFASFLFLQSPETLSLWTKKLQIFLENNERKTMVIDYYLFFCFHLAKKFEGTSHSLYSNNAFELISKFDPPQAKTLFKNLFKYSQSINETSIFTQQRV